MKYGYSKKTNLSFDDTLAKVIDELKKEGFGVLTEINVQTALKEKLDVDHEKYLILGACNPQFAYQALQTEKEIGLLLPCNITVYQDKDQVFVSAILPTVAMQMVNNKTLDVIASQAEEKLKKVIDSI